MNYRKLVSFILAVAIVGSMPFNILALPLSEETSSEEQTEVTTVDTSISETTSVSTIISTEEITKETEIPPQPPTPPVSSSVEEQNNRPGINNEESYISINGFKLEPNSDIVWFCGIDSYDIKMGKRDVFIIDGEEAEPSQISNLEDGKYKLGIYGKQSKYYSIGIDRVFPEVKALYNPYTNFVRIMASDNLSGIKSYALNNSDNFCTVDEFGVTETSGDVNAVFVSDNAGNILETSAQQFPLTINTNGYTFNPDVPAGNPVTLVPSLNDNGRCPAHSFQYSRDGGNTWVNMSQSGNILINNSYDVEEYIVRAICADGSDFEISRQSVKINVDTEVPDMAEVIINGEQDETGAYITIPEIVVISESGSNTIVTLDGVDYPIGGIPENKFSEGEHKITVTVIDTAGNETTTPEYDIFINAVKPEISDISVNSVYSISNDRKKVSCFEDMRIDYVCNDETSSAILMCNGVELNSDTYTQSGNSFIINKTANFSGKLSIKVSDAEGSEIIYYLGEVSEVSSSVFKSVPTLSEQEAVTVLYDNSKLDSPEISVSQGTKNAVYNKDITNLSWIDLNNGEKIEALFTEPLDEGMHYQYRNEDEVNWVDCGEKIEISSSGKYQFRTVSDDGIATKVQDIYFIDEEKCNIIDNADENGEEKTADFWNTSSKTVEIINPTVKDVYDENEPITYVHCDVYVDTETEQGLHVGYIKISSDGIVQTTSLNKNYIDVDNDERRSTVTLNATGIYKFHHWTTDTNDNNNSLGNINLLSIRDLDTAEDIADKPNVDIARIQLETPVIEDFTIKGEVTNETESYIEKGEVTASLNPLDSLCLFFTSANLATVDYYIDYGLCGADEDEPVKVEYKLAMSEEWKLSDNQKLPDNNRYDIRITAKNKAGLVSQMVSSALVIDTERPKRENNAPDIITNFSGELNGGFYSSDISVDISVKDHDINGSSSGLESVVYWVSDTSTDEVIYSEELFISDSNETTPYEKLDRSFSGNFTIPSNYNSNSLVLYVLARDNAGNANVSTRSFKIDTTNPEVVVTYDNNHTVNDMFTDSRTAYITVHEVNFDESDVKIIAKNSYGEDISVSGWSHSGSTHTATVSFIGDGEYEFDISYIDSAENTAVISYEDCVQPNSFEIDMTVPELDIRLEDGSKEISGKYQTEKIAYVTVKDKNLDNEQSVFEVTKDGKTITVQPELVRSDGDNYTYEFAIPFSDDADYTLKVTAGDRAGHIVSTETYQITVDTQSPEITVTGFEKANNGSVVPIIEFSDINLDNDSVTIKLEGANSGSVYLDKNDKKEDGYRKVEIENFKEITTTDDDLYTLTVSAKDSSGNETSKQFMFTINRTGPVYVVDSSLDEYLNNYNKEARDIIVRVYDINEIVSTEISIIKDGSNSKSLSSGAGYVEKDAVHEDNLYMYEYLIKATNFEENGNYNVTITSKDTASNSNDNTAVKLSMSSVEENKDESAEIRFTIDNIAPSLMFDDIASNSKYNTDLKTVSFIMQDNVSLLDNEDVEVIVDGIKAEVINVGEKYQFNIGTRDSAQNIVVKCIDHAGNISEIAFDNVLVTSDKFQLYKNQILAAVIALLVCGVTIGSVVIRRKKR